MRWCVLLRSLLEVFATKLATPDEARKMDKIAVDLYGMDGIVLMENAGAAVARAAAEVGAERRGCLAPWCGWSAGRLSTCIFAGKGNNGGDGFVAARHLVGYGINVSVYVTGSLDGISGAARANLEILRNMGVDVVPLASEEAWSSAAHDLAWADVAVDAILGTGAKGAPSGEAARAISMMNGSHAPIIAVDLPSGVDAYNGSIKGTCVTAHTTVTFALPKTGLLTYPGAEHVGRLMVDHIGLPAALIDSREIKTSLVGPDDVSSSLPRRRPEAHKGDCGRVLVVAGSRGMAGAAALASRAALRTGAGLVFLATPESVASQVSAGNTEVIVIPLPETSQGAIHRSAVDRILDKAARCDALVVGPGLTASQDSSIIVEALSSKCRVPMVLDADALNVLAGRPEIRRQSAAPVILTPHPGEMSRLTGAKIEDIEADRLGWARRAASLLGAVVVLKGARTVTATPDGFAYLNPTGNPGMATAGSGDVLSGVVGSLMAQGVPSVRAAISAVFLHGLAGDIAALEVGVHGMVAGDILLRIPKAYHDTVEESAGLWEMMPVRRAR
jgi:hydroxyethylthiazole kinase-like uncharacterized protein yjeF